MKIKALKPFTLRDSSTGALKSIACGCAAEFDSTAANQLITDGLAEAYTLITPTGSVNITKNGTVDVTQYASAVVNVGSYTVSYDSNGGTGTITDVTVIAGNSLDLNDGSTLTPPTDKVFAGWADSSTAETANISSPYTPTQNATLYAVWGDGE